MIHASLSCLGQSGPILLMAPTPKAAQHVLERLLVFIDVANPDSRALGDKGIARLIENRQHPHFLPHRGLAKWTHRFAQKGKIRSHPAVTALVCTRPNGCIFLWDDLRGLASVHLHSPSVFIG